MKECIKLGGCEGFSFENGKQEGSGCFKHKCNSPCDVGFGEGSHDYYECEAVGSKILELKEPEKIKICAQLYDQCNY